VSLFFLPSHGSKDADVTGRVWYWGDLDPPGLRIAVDASGAATAATVPEIRSAAGLWVAHGQRPIQDSGGIDWSAAPGRHWLGVQMWDQLAHVRDANGRVAHESVPAEIIAAWAAAIE
jgi:hypothetical protein